LSPPSSALWRALLSDYEGWGKADLVLLELALRAHDQAAQCQRRIAREGITLRGKRGSVRAHPLLRVERQAVASAAAIFRQLNLGGAPR
jgi:P27 family predicted phage terminase small subunit